VLPVNHNQRIRSRRHSGHRGQGLDLPDMARVPPKDILARSPPPRSALTMRVALNTDGIGVGGFELLAASLLLGFGVLSMAILRWRG
jgi:hypothetical protein